MVAATSDVRHASLMSMCFGMRNGKPLFLKLRSSSWYITAVVCTAVFTDIFLYAVIVPVFPFSLVERVGILESEVQHWLSILLAIYGAALLVGAPICGILADRFKYRQTPMLLGLLIMAVSTIILCLAKSVPVLIIGRLLQGLAASVTWVVGLALLSDTGGKEEIAETLGYVGAALSLSTLVAPLLGGIVYQTAGYYAVFAMCFGLIVLDVVLRLALIEKGVAAQWLHPDVEMVEQDTSLRNTSARASTSSMCEEQPSSPVTLAQTDRKRSLPPILILLSSRRMIAATCGIICLSIIMNGMDTTLTLFLSRTFGWDSLAAGLMFLTILTPNLLGPVFGSLVDKYGSRWISAAGFIIIIPSCVLLRLVDHDSTRQKVLLGALLVLLGFGTAMVLNGLMAEFGRVCDAKEEEEPGLFGENGAYAQSYAIFNGAWAAGSLIGAFWSGGVYSAAGWGTMGWSFALLCGVTFIPVLLFTDGWIGMRQAKKT